MGTRHLIAVKDGGDYKVAQYGQWDGFPAGQGMAILKFISNYENISRLKEALAKCRFIDNEKDKEFIEDYERRCGEPDRRTKEEKTWFEKYISRDIGADILKNIAESTEDEILLKDSRSFASDLFCEWGYVIDFDKKLFEVYKGFNRNPLDSSARFYSEKPDDSGYYPIRLVAAWSLNDLPDRDDFIEKFNED